MLKILRKILPLMVLGILCSCDPVAEDDRYHELEAVEVQRVVLLEEFTGQNCSNCPTAHEEIEKLQAQYGSSLIVVSTHATQLAFPEGLLGPNAQTFRTDESEAYANMHGVVEIPAGVVNRVSGLQSHKDWAMLIRQQLTRPTNLNISLQAQLQDGQLQVSTFLNPGEDIEGKLQLWVVEDSIISIQNNSGKMVADYVHNNIFRTSINGVGGEPVSLKANVYATLQHTLPVKEVWDLRHLSVVAFVYNDKDGVINAVRAIVQ